MLVVAGSGRDALPGSDAEPVLHPAARFSHPADVLKDPTLTDGQKRTILSAWASDAWAIPSAPAWRKPPGARRAVAIDDILSALSRLDDPPSPRPGGTVMRLPPSQLAWRSRRPRMGRMTRRYLERHVFRPPAEVAAARTA
jgi:hypothetical protein